MVLCIHLILIGRAIAKKVASHFTSLLNVEIRYLHLLSMEYQVFSSVINQMDILVYPQPNDILTNLKPNEL